MGAKAYPSLASVTEQIDLVVMSTDIKFVPGLLEECKSKGIKNFDEGGLDERSISHQDNRPGVHKLHR